jgi:hypothetical protein
MRNLNEQNKREKKKSNQLVLKIGGASAIP